MPHALSPAQALRLSPRAASDLPISRNQKLSMPKIWLNFSCIFLKYIRNEIGEKMDAKLGKVPNKCCFLSPSGAEGNFLI